ncbi:MAG: hypothetical protein ACTSRH_16140 [Promethearchaeota archaeon]
MKKIVVRFTTKTWRSSLDDAISIAKKYKHEVKGNFYFVHFNDLSNNLKNLLDLVKSWKTTRIFLSDEEVNVKSFYNTFFCDEKLFCNGICLHLVIEWYNLINLIEKIKEMREIGFSYGPLTKPFSLFLEQAGNNQFKLNKNKLSNIIKKELSFEFKNCPKINKEKMLNLINNLPERLESRDIVYSFETQTNARSFEFINNLEYSNMDQIKEIAEIFADAFEKRLKKVLREFFSDKRSK